MDDIKYLMDGRKNPLSQLPPPQRFQTMTLLSMMWTPIFCIGTDAWMWFGELAVAHVLFAGGFLITDMTFRSADNEKRTYRAYPRRDGSARYDDVWGG